MSFRIEKGIDVPAPQLGSGQRKYPFPDMKPGESFLVPVRDPAERRIRAKSIMVAARRWVLRQPEPRPRFTGRQVAEGVRIWRIE